MFPIKFLRCLPIFGNTVQEKKFVSQQIQKHFGSTSYVSMCLEQPCNIRLRLINTLNWNIETLGSDPILTSFVFV